MFADALPALRDSVTDAFGGEANYLRVASGEESSVMVVWRTSLLGDEIEAQASIPLAAMSRPSRGDVIIRGQSRYLVVSVDDDAMFWNLSLRLSSLAP